jgi:AGCS family alanine or glycine:cation symporter
MERAEEVFGDDRSEKIVVWILRICTITTVFVGSLTTSGISWTLGDIGVGAMAWINLIAILLLSPKALRALRDYEKSKKQGEEPQFDPKKMDIEGADFWEEKNISLH